VAENSLEGYSAEFKDSVVIELLRKSRIVIFDYILSLYVSVPYYCQPFGEQQL